MSHRVTVHGAPAIPPHLQVAKTVTGDAILAPVADPSQILYDKAALGRGIHLAFPKFHSKLLGTTEYARTTLPQSF